MPSRQDNAFSVRVGDEFEDADSGPGRHNGIVPAGDAQVACANMVKVNPFVIDFEKPFPELVLLVEVPDKSTVNRPGKRDIIVDPGLDSKEIL
jgi:hypothetical protein